LSLQRQQYWVQIGVTSLMVLGLACPSAADEAPPGLTVAAALANPAWADSLRRQLYGRVRLVFADSHLLGVSPAFVVKAVEVAAKDCGISVGVSADPNTDHLVWLVPLSHPTYDDVFAKMLALSKERGGEFNDLTKTEFDDRIKTIAKDAFEKLIQIGIYNAKIGSSGNRERSSTIVFIDSDKVSIENSTEVAEYAVFAGIVGVSAYDSPVDSNSFSYIIGGGPLSDIVGDDVSHYAKLCSALPLIRSVCDGSLTLQSKETIKQNLSGVVDRCQPDSPVVKSLREIDETIQRSLSGK
jgi:hypothetical protein